MEKNNDKKRFLKQKKFLLSSLYALCLIAKGINVNAEEKNEIDIETLSKNEISDKVINLEQIFEESKQLGFNDLFEEPKKEIQLKDIITPIPKRVSKTKKTVINKEGKSTDNNKEQENLPSKNSESKKEKSMLVELVDLGEIYRQKEKVGFEALIPNNPKKKINIEEMIEVASRKKEEIEKSTETEKNIDIKRNNNLAAGVSKQLADSLTKGISKQNNNLIAGITKNLQNIVSVSYENALINYEKEKEEKELEEAEKTVYYDFPCPKEWQDYIFIVSEQTGVPFEIMMTILDQESDGLWNANGKISPTNDYGIAQINIVNHKEILKNLGITSEDLRYNPYKAIDAQAYLLKKFMNFYGYTKDNFDYENIFGTYNGGTTNWRNYEGACVYAASCLERLERHFGESLKLK